MLVNREKMICAEKMSKYIWTKCVLKKGRKFLEKMRQHLKLKVYVTFFFWYSLIMILKINIQFCNWQLHVASVVTTLAQSHCLQCQLQNCIFVLPFQTKKKKKKFYLLNVEKKKLLILLTAGCFCFNNQKLTILFQKAIFLVE